MDLVYERQNDGEEIRYLELLYTHWPVLCWRQQLAVVAALAENY